MCVCVCVWLYEHKGAHKTKSGSKSLESYHKLDPNSEAQSLIRYMYFQFLDYNRQIDSWRQASPKLLWVERWPSHFHFLWIWECVVYSSSWLGGALKVILFCDYSKNLEAERSAPISCHFPFDSWRQSKNQKEIIVYHQRQRNQDTDKTIFICFLIQAGRNKYPGLIKKWRRCLLLFQAIKKLEGDFVLFLQKNLIDRYYQDMICDCPFTQNKKGKT